MGSAIELATKDLDIYAKKISYLRDYYIIETQRNIPFTKLNGHIYKRLPGNANLSFDGVNGETLILLLAEKGIYCSGGSACSTGDKNPSHVLKAIDLPDGIANSAIRMTFGEENTIEDVKYIVKTLKEIVKRLREN